MIEVNKLDYTYPGQTLPALCDVSFSVRRGEVFGFLGPSGAGKSTMQRILYRLLTGYRGSARLMNTELRDWDQKIYHHIGVCFELPNHYLRLSALENLRFFGSFYPACADPLSLLERVGLGESAHKRVGEFSKGMKMRLNFIRALLHGPDVLFLDEPTSGLDPANARIVKDLILEQKGAGKTVFLTTHQMHDAEELCDNIAFIAQGKILAMDSPAGFRQRYSTRKVQVDMGGENGIFEYDLEGLGTNPGFLELIRKNDPRTIHSREAGLDEIFIRLTGQSLL